jgi:RNA polymerase sigma-70 factor (ECF subfamily)
VDGIVVAPSRSSEYVRVLHLRAPTQYSAESDATLSRDEAALIRRLAQGDTLALQALIATYSAPLVAYASRVLDDGDSAEEIAADVFVRLWEKRASVDARALRSFLFTVARNAALDELRRRRSRNRIGRLWKRAMRAGSADPAAVLEEREVSVAVDRAIQRLPDRQREVFELAYLRQLSYREVAEVMGISWKTVGNHLSAALKELRRTLRPLLEESSRPD